ncbi:MAG: DUF1326 domain-containing protein [Alphaproteobacteria bacterium]|nr:DUF1326 domain-containing protein [Alphaproteobacteria bacterium]
MTEWYVKGQELANCNCDYGCPCQFNALPTYGDCRAAVGYRIDEGQYGDVSLNGMRAAMIASWPKAIHEGDGTIQHIVDETASEAQREAMLKIMRGENTEPMTTMWSVFSAMTTTFLDPIVAPISFDLDIDGRTGKLSIPGVVEITAEPIRNPVSGAEHRARIELPHGFEYHVAEMASGTTRTGADAGIELALDKSYTQLADIHLSNTGRMN